MHSSSDLGGGLPVMATKNVVDGRGTSPVVVVYSDTLGTSPVSVIVVYGIAFVVGVGGGSGGGHAVVQATNGGGTTAVGPQHRHSVLATSVSAV